MYVRYAMVLVGFLLKKTEKQCLESANAGKNRSITID